MKKLFVWLDNNILTIFSFFLIAFIPLFPKIPIMELIPGYIVRVRLEDFFILLGFIIFLIQVLRKKATYKSVVFWPMVIYLVVGFLSSLSAIFITKSVPWDMLHIGKMFIHWVRRIEYFSIFFIFFNGIKSLKNLKKIITWSLLIISLVAIYGYGQKYLYWPVYSTMNREFSKGMKLYLTEHARVPSTFGGHYDLAAFLVIFLVVFLSLFLIVKKKLLKYTYLAVFLLSYWLMILTASRTSFIAYLVAVTILLFIFAFKKGLFWSSSRWLVIISFSLFVMASFGDLSERFAHFFGMPKIKEKFKLDNLLKPIKAPPTNFIALNNDIQLVMDSTDERPTETKPTDEVSNLPPDVYENIPDYKLATGSATGSGKLTATTSGVLVPVSRIFSDNAYKYGLSTAIRLDALWPWAIEAFKRNPLLGSGYSTLNRSSLGDFTEAESTDNDYLRILGETGLLGFISFFGIIFVILKTLIKVLQKSIDPFLLAFVSAFIAASFGLLINAMYIDVFEASKVALTYWALAGALLAVLVNKKVLSKIK